MSDDNMQLDEEIQSNSPLEETSKVEAPTEWESLDSKSQNRFQVLANQKRDAELKAVKEEAKRQSLEDEVKRLRESQFNSQKIPMPSTSNMTAEEKSAYERLNTLGMADREYVDSQLKAIKQEMSDQNYYDKLHLKVETEISSDKGLPGYNRSEIENHMRESNIYDPRAAYRDLYYDEIVSHEAQKINNKNKRTVKTEGTRSRISTSEPWTKERISERINQPDGQEWYRKNREKILKMQGTLS